jgi:hypothetical protein
VGRRRCVQEVTRPVDRARSQNGVVNKKATLKKRKPRKRTTTHASARGPFLVPHPLRGAELDIRRKYVAAVAEAAAIRFKEHLGRLVTLAGEVSPLHVLAILSSYALMKSVNEADFGGKRLSRTGEVLQGHVEYLQALLLRHAWVARDPPEPDVMQEVFDVLPALFEAYAEMRVPRRRQAPGDEDHDAERLAAEQLATEAVQEVLRSHTAVVRNWGYFNAVRRIAGEVLGSADVEFCGEYGLTLTQTIRLFEHLVRRLERNVNDFRRRMFEVFQAGSPPQMGHELAHQFVEFKGVEEFRELLCDGGMTPREAQFRIVVALEGVLPKFLMFDAQTIAKELGLDEAAAFGLLKRLSLSFGDLRDRTPESLLLDNPMWLQPLIEVQHGIFFSAVPQTLMSFVLQIVESLARPHVALRERLRRDRAQYLEDATERLLRAAFPGCELVRGYKWTEGDRRYESDLALRYDATILLVESKSGGVSWSALRGAPQRMVRQIQDLIVDPSDQSARLAERLKEAIAGTPGPVADFPLPLEGVRAISRLSVTLHDFATVQSIPRLLLDAGLIRSEHRLAPCLTLADLEVVVDILDTPYLRMHYLRRRAELLTTAVTFGDELDSLGMYLDTGFNIGKAEAGTQQLMMIGYSAKLDRYYSRIDESLPARKPKVNITPWIRALCDQLMTRASAGWYEMAHALLTLGHDEQLRVERELRKRIKWMRTGKPAKNGLDSVVVEPQVHRRMAMAFQMRMPDDRRPSKETAVNLASHAFEASHVEVCAIFGFRADVEDMSYRSANLWYRTDRPVEARTYL